jgi:hypothetical protein
MHRPPGCLFFRVFTRDITPTSYRKISMALTAPCACFNGDLTCLPLNSSNNRCVITIADDLFRRKSIATHRQLAEEMRLKPTFICSKKSPVYDSKMNRKHSVWQSS